MRCKGCGAESIGSENYCRKCGRVLEEDLGTTIEFRPGEVIAAEMPEKGSWKKTKFYLPLFFSVCSLICVIALCVSVLAYAINYDVHSGRVQKISSRSYSTPAAELPEEYSAVTTKAPEVTAPAETTTTTKETTTTTSEATTTTTTTTTTKKETATTEEEFDFFDLFTTTTAEEPEEDYNSLVEPSYEYLMDIMWVDSTKGALFLRTGPGYYYANVNSTGIPAGSEVYVYGEAYDDAVDEMWLYVRSGEYRGWVTMSMLSHTAPANSPSDSISGRTRYFRKANMYEGPGATYERVAVIPSGSEITIYDYSDDGEWVYVNYGYDWGWISADDLR